MPKPRTRLDPLLSEGCFARTSAFILSDQNPTQRRPLVTERGSVLYYVNHPRQGMTQMRPVPTSLLRRMKSHGKRGYSYQRPSARTGRTSTFVKKYNFQYFLNIPDNSVIFLIHSNFHCPRPNSRIYMKYKLFIFNHTTQALRKKKGGKKINKSDPYQRNIKTHLSRQHKGDSCFKINLQVIYTLCESLNTYFSKFSVLQHSVKTYRMDLEEEKENLKDNISHPALLQARF